MRVRRRSWGAAAMRGAGCSIVLGMGCSMVVGLGCMAGLGSEVGGVCRCLHSGVQGELIHRCVYLCID